MASGKMGGLNLGSVFGDETHGTPDCIIVDGHLTKLGRVAWTYDVSHATDPWTFTSDADGVSLTHVPTNEFVEVVKTDLGFYKTEIHKPYGPWSGTVRLDDGTEIEIDGVLGGAEYVETTW